jgi:hypothetical protein
MRVLIEGEKYPLLLLEELIDARFYKTFGLDGVISHVGYFYSYANNELIYVIPKVFINNDNKVLFDFDKSQLAISGKYILEHKKFHILKHFLVLFYRSLLEYKKRHPLSSFINKNESLNLDTNLGDKEYSYLDIVLNLINFHKKNHNVILFNAKSILTQRYKKPSWEKTIRKRIPYVDVEKDPFYIEAYNQKKIIDSEEILLSMFYSVLFHLKEKYKFNITIDKIYTIHKGKSFLNMSKKAPKILRKIRHNYFSDILIKIYRLLEIYYSSSETAKSNNKYCEFIRVDNYHLIFEDMVDKLFTDKLPRNLKKLKEQKDGKVLDHIFKYDALVDSEEKIFYVGDSKYYKVDSSMGEISKYKQFTYAKNIIHFNVGVMNGKNEDLNDDSLQYRDNITEGYNINPNFFIQGKIFNDLDFNEEKINISNKKSEPDTTYHFENRLFDRDTLFVHYYDINFLFVLKSYTQISSFKLKDFRKKCKNEFRMNLIKYLNKNFYFYQKNFDSINDLESYININFKKLVGKIYRTKNNPKKLIYATCQDDCIFDGFSKFSLE